MPNTRRIGWAKLTLEYCAAGVASEKPHPHAGPRRKAREAKPNSLCMDCLNAHVQYAANGRRETSCGYGGTMRPMKLDVLYCTDYGARNQPVPARAVGFVREIAPFE